MTARLSRLSPEQQAHQRAYQRAYRLAHRRPLAKSNAILGAGIVIFDPDPVGGFAAGATLNNVPAMLALSAFTIGTRLTYRGRPMRVHLGPDGRQMLVFAAREQERRDDH